MKNSLELRAALLTLIDQHRQTGDPELGTSIVRMIIEEDLRDLDRDILSNPGALEAQLVLLRPKRI